jgi:hypothetical protein
LIGNLSKFVIDVGKCFALLPPRKTVLQNGDSTAKGILYPAVCKDQLCKNCTTTVMHVSELIHQLERPFRIGAGV